MSIQLSKLSMLSTLSLLESKLTFINNSFYRISEDFQSQNIISLHKEASKIFHFLGLYNYTVIITYVKLDQNAGNIELNNNSDKIVYINIDEKYKNSKETVLCILAHEICHKLLFVNNLHTPNMTMENEVRTDLATIITGLGKLTLNGCRHLRINNKAIIQNKIGYLSDKQFAEAFYYVYISRGFTAEKMLDGLDLTIRGYLESLIKNNSYKIGSCLTTNYIIKTIQEKEASLLYYVKYLSYICEQINQMVKHSIINKTSFIDSKGLNICNNDKPISLLYTLTNIEEQFKDISKFQYLTDKIEQFIHDIYNSVEKLDTHNNSIICPLCGFSNNRIIDNNGVYKCPKCHKLFYNKTTLYTYNDKADNKKEKEIQSLKDKISKLETELIITNQKINKFENGSLKYRLKAIFKKNLPL